MTDFRCNKQNDSVVFQCKGCSDCGSGSNTKQGCKNSTQKTLDQSQKIIQKVVRVDSGQYQMNKSSLSVYQNSKDTNQRFKLYNYPSTMSDRRSPHIIPKTLAIHRNANSKHSSKTKGWPGMTSASGEGVDVKHGSYERYLARKKGLILKAGVGAYKDSSKRTPTYDDIVSNPNITTGGKNVKFSILSNCEC